MLTDLYPDELLLVYGFKATGVIVSDGSTDCLHVCDDEQIRFAHSHQGNPVILTPDGKRFAKLDFVRLNKDGQLPGDVNTSGRIKYYSFNCFLDNQDDAFSMEKVATCECLCEMLKSSMFVFEMLSHIFLIGNLYH